MQLSVSKGVGGVFLAFILIGTIAAVAAGVIFLNVQGEGKAHIGDGNQADRSSYTDWLHVPGKVVKDAKHYNFRYVNVRSLRENKEHLGEKGDFMLNEVESEFIKANNISTYLEVGSKIVVRSGDFNRTRLGKNIRNYRYADIAREGTHRGYTLFEESDDELEALAIDNTTYIYSQGTFSDIYEENMDFLEVAKTSINTKTGEEKRYIEQSEVMNTLTKELGSGTFVCGGTTQEIEEKERNGEFEGQIAGGRKATIDGGKAIVKYVFIFKDSSDVNITDIREESTTHFPELEDISREGRVVTGRAKTDTKNFLGFFDEYHGSLVCENLY